MYQKPNYNKSPTPFNIIKTIDIEWFINFNGFQSFRKIIESKWFAGINTSKNELYVWK
ncbi:hypothetical protein [Spiroplasma sp. SV19]|uniref:hypothetical protein n=1 Tax=Spiroplasma sp. SV19 TaxID=2570468 RepID=UPI0024B69691|nr:hypothetical protein [Spiroplasma sp. SV19]